MLEGCDEIRQFTMKVTAGRTVKHPNGYLDTFLSGFNPNKAAASCMKIQ